MDPEAQIQDPGCKKSGFGINIPDPQYCLKKEDDLAFATEVRIRNFFSVEHLPGTR
jgi:hypothetical protein